MQCHEKLGFIDQKLLKTITLGSYRNFCLTHFIHIFTSVAKNKHICISSHVQVLFLELKIVIFLQDLHSYIQVAYNLGKKQKTNHIKFNFHTK